MRIVLDTNILVRSHAAATGPARELLRLLAASGQHTLVLSTEILQEVERVFRYQRVRKVARLTDEQVARYLRELQLASYSETVFPGPAPRVVPRDPDDDPVVHTAVVGRADVICTL